MSVFLEITAVYAREILDSRGNPTVEASVTVKSDADRRKYTGTAAVPSGASTGQLEAVELRDFEKRYAGLGVTKAVHNVNEVIAPALLGMNASSQVAVDRRMIDLDGTDNKSMLGANAILAVSLAVAKAAAGALHISLYEYLGGICAKVLPVPMMNIINGGAHSRNSIDFQEFMILPVGASSFREALRMGSEVYHSLKKVLSAKYLSTAVGDEGGFAPDIDSVEGVLDILCEAVKGAGYECGKDICFAMDVAASEFKSRKGTGVYELPKSGKEYRAEELIGLYRSLADKYPIVSIEDPLDEEDWEGWKLLTKELGDRLKLVGDDLFVTNTERLTKGMNLQAGNAILIKYNQIGTLSETIEAIQTAAKGGFSAIVSHRSGETEDTTIADLCVALNTGLIKTGAPARSERVSKYNRLLRIEEELGCASEFPGKTIFHKPETGKN